jgi:predicted ATPase
MSRMKLDSVTIEGLTSIEAVTVQLRDLNVLVGANGAGKSNFIAALGMLGRIMEGELGLFVGLSGGAGALLHGGGAEQIRLTLDFLPNRYVAELIPGSGDELIFLTEKIFFRGAGYENPFEVKLGSGHRETRLPDEVKTHGQGSIAGHVMAMLRGCRVYHFHDTSRGAPVKQQGYVSDNLALHSDARNLAAVLLRLRESDHACYDRILGTVRQVAPFFRDFVLEPEVTEERLRLRWRQEGADTILPADALSDGTLRFMCLATLLGQPELPNVVILDEPELGLHPFAIVQLAEMLRTASRESQVLAATQSVTLMNQFELEDLVVVERRDGASEFDRPDPDRLRDWLADYALGELWEMNLLGGRPRPEHG